MPHKIHLNLVLLLFLLAFSKCGSISNTISKSEVFNKNHTGFYLYDPSEKKVLADINAHKYFTPASNTKIFTFYTALNILGDSIPAIKYRMADDSLIIWGTGDPSFLHPDFPSNKVLDFLKKREENIYISFENFQDEPFGPGWAWDDYPFYYQPEKAPFPIYGNVIHLFNRPDTAGLIIEPNYFELYNYPMVNSMDPGVVRRDLTSNLIFTGAQPDSIYFDTRIPFIYSPDLFIDLLEDTLNREISIIDLPQDQNNKIFYSIPSDTLYKIMMQESDNFFAEQILLMCADNISDTLNTKIAIDYSKTNLLADLKDEPIWIDGSGLSRYNLFTPSSIVQLWEKIYALVSQDRLFNILASGGNSGTISNWYTSEEPYIWGKTGTLSNNHCLSGFLKTKKGRILIFSFMHNNYVIPSAEIKNEMQEILTVIRETY